MPGLPPAQDEAGVIAEIRANVVFEKMIVSVLTVAGFSAAAHFLIAFALRLSANALSFAGLGSLVMNAILFAAFFFLAGFAASVAIGIPLFRALEKAKLRKPWPYGLAALVVSFLILAAAGAPPSVEAPQRALYLLPGLAAALLFARRMKPFWEAAVRREEEPQTSIIWLR
ncbi:MAG: hypothetical protein KDE05_04665 [Parvularculaceae bacterium]|nr:hypothetical protein [Parvularculaceae bacterium]